jgi:hypothetical protein
MSPQKKRRPITAARCEEALDKLAWLMSVADHPELVVPLWKRMERERDRLREEEATIAAALSRLTRSQDRTEARSG